MKKLFLFMFFVAFSGSVMGYEKQLDEVLKSFDADESAAMGICFVGFDQKIRKMSKNSGGVREVKGMADLYLDASVVLWSRTGSTSAYTKKTLRRISKDTHQDIPGDFMMFCEKGGIFYEHAKSLTRK